MPSFDRPPQPDMRHEAPPITDVPETEIWVAFARSGGPGGQNVNKRETKAVLKWHVDGSLVYTDEQKARIKEMLANQLNDEGFIVLTSQAERSQDQNRRDAIEKLRRLVRAALKEDAERIPTKPTRSSQRARLDEKTIRSRQKQERRHVDWDD